MTKIDVNALLEQLKSDRNAAIARQRLCIKNMKTCQSGSKEELNWAQEYDKAWLESSNLKTAITIIEKTMDAYKGEQK